MVIRSQPKESGCRAGERAPPYGATQRTTTDGLPKTRSGKIMRRVLKAVILDHDPGDISTIEDEGSVAEAREAWKHMKEEVTGQQTGRLPQRASALARAGTDGSGGERPDRGGAR
jgi:hypothetical protein